MFSSFYGIVWFVLKRRIGGWGGIRTHGNITATPVFKTGSLNHSDTHPYRKTCTKTYSGSSCEREETADAAPVFVNLSVHGVPAGRGRQDRILKLPRIPIHAARSASAFIAGSGMKGKRGRRHRNVGREGRTGGVCLRQGVINDHNHQSNRL